MRRLLTSALISVLLLMAVCSGAVAGPTPNIAYEDRNNNGVFDDGDVDIVNVLLVDGYFVSDRSVVVARLVVPQGLPSMGILIQAAKNITVTGSIDPGYPGFVTLIAGGIVRLGDKVILKSHSGIEIDAQDIVVGNNVLLTSTHSHVGGSHYSQIRLDASRNVQVGTRLRAIALYSVVLHADSGALTVGPSSVLQAPTVDLDAGASIVADKVVMKAKEQVGVFGLGPGVSVSLKGATAVVGRDGAIYIHAEGGAVDITGARFNVVPDILAETIIP